jgi:hypothetical protein
MKSEWILDVLADLRIFAMSNQLPLLAEHLDDTALIAMAEIANLEERSGRRTYENAGQTRSHPRRNGASEIA